MRRKPIFVHFHHYVVVKYIHDGIPYAMPHYFEKWNQITCKWVPYAQQHVVIIRQFFFIYFLTILVSYIIKWFDKILTRGSNIMESVFLSINFLNNLFYIEKSLVVFCVSLLRFLLSNQNPRLEGGTRWTGSSVGKSCPSILMLIRCIARANSSASNIPSLSTSDNFQTLPNTLFGSLDLTISCFAAEK